MQFDANTSCVQGRVLTGDRLHPVLCLCQCQLGQLEDIPGRLPKTTFLDEIPFSITQERDHGFRGST